MNSSYVQALETKARWLRWAETKPGLINVERSPRILDTYLETLKTPDTHFMNAKFCDLVDHARQSVPDDLKFDISWAHGKEGWLWMETPFQCPPFIVNKEQGVNPVDVKIRAVGWLAATKVTDDMRGYRWSSGDGSATLEGITFLFFLEIPKLGFGPWAYFTLKNDDILIDRIHKFESSSSGDGAYPQDRKSELLHEMRWLYAAFHLMNQRLAVEVPVTPDRAQRKRAAREGRAPEQIKVISLRRLEAARERAATAGGESVPVDWNWQWEVRGHWRNQFYRASGEHRPVFIEAYIKGPESKPLKAPGKKLFVAVR
jgi:hypothetical protein